MLFILKFIKLSLYIYRKIDLYGFALFYRKYQSNIIHRKSNEIEIYILIVNK